MEGFGIQPKKRWLAIGFICILVLCFVLSTFSGHLELRNNGIYKRNTFQMSKKIEEIDSVKKIEWLFESSYVSTGSVRYGGHRRVTLSCIIWVGDNKFSFDRFSLNEIPTIVELFCSCPQLTTNKYLLADWLLDLDCDEQLYMFLKNYFIVDSITQ